MDMAFLMRAERMLARECEQAPAIDHGILVAALASHQSASPTARAAAEARRCAGDWRGHHALAELLAGGPAWREARRAQRGSFHGARCDAAGKEP